MKIYGYLRISKDTSDTENQLYQVEEYCMKTYQRLPDETIEDDVISGKTKACDRKLGELLNKMEKGDILIIASTSRYGRNFFDVMQTASILYEKEAKFYAIQTIFSLVIALVTNPFQNYVLLLASTVILLFWALLNDPEKSQNLRDSQMNYGISEMYNKGYSMGYNKYCVLTIAVVLLFSSLICFLESSKSTVILICISYLLANTYAIYRYNKGNPAENRKVARRIRFGMGFFCYDNREL